MTDVRVPVGACRCPGSPHDGGDWVDLRPAPTIDIGSAVYAAVANVGDDPMALQVELGRAYLRYGITAWSFTDARGEPIAVAPRRPGFDELVSRLLPFSQGGFDVSDMADTLYSEEVLRPLTTRLSTMHSQDGQTDGSTSPIPPSTPTSRKRSPRSSPAGSGGRQSADPAG